MFVPIADPPGILPSDVSLDRGSSWHTSALFSTALESVTLPARLKAVEGSRFTLHDLELALNANRNQHIANMQLSVGSPEPVPLANERAEEGSISPTGVTAGLRVFDMDLSTKTDDEVRKSGVNTMHTFGQVEVTRDDRSVAEEVENSSRRQRTVVSPTVLRSVRKGCMTLLARLPWSFRASQQVLRLFFF